MKRRKPTQQGLAARPIRRSASKSARQIVEDPFALVAVSVQRMMRCVHEAKFAGDDAALTVTIVMRSEGGRPVIETAAAMTGVADDDPAKARLAALMDNALESVRDRDVPAGKTEVRDAEPVEEDDHEKEEGEEEVALDN